MIGLNVAQRALLAGGGVSGVNVADVFDIDLWTGTGSAQSLTTPFAPSMVWIKQRSSTESHGLFDATRGATKYLSSNATTAETTDAQTLTAFNAGGYSLGTGGSLVNTNTATYVGWAFKEAANFFDVVTYTGTGGTNHVAHALGIRPGFIIIKRTDSTGPWGVVAYTGSTFAYFTSSGSALNTTGASNFSDVSTTVITTTTFEPSYFQDTGGSTNVSGASYVAYLFAHDTAAGGVIRCGSFTTDGSGNATVSAIGWEPQWLLAKPSSGTGNWIILDQTRGWGGTDNSLFPNLADAESAATDYGAPTSTGFTFANGGATVTWVYAAIRKP